jgi:hypothetical protein
MRGVIRRNSRYNVRRIVWLEYEEDEFEPTSVRVFSRRFLGSMRQVGKGGFYSSCATDSGYGNRAGGCRASDGSARKSVHADEDCQAG